MTVGKIQVRHTSGESGSLGEMNPVVGMTTIGLGYITHINTDGTILVSHNSSVGASGLGVAANETFVFEDQASGVLPGWQAGYGDPIFYDTFTDASGTALASHTPNIGGSWTALAGTWVVHQSNAARPSATTATESIAHSTIRNIGEASVTISNIGSGIARMGIVADLVDTNNYWKLSIAGDSGNKIILSDKVTGTVTDRLVVPSVSGVNGSIIGLRSLSDRMHVLLDGNLVGEYVFGAAITGGKWGLYRNNQGDSSILFDNFSFKSTDVIGTWPSGVDCRLNNFENRTYKTTTHEYPFGVLLSTKSDINLIMGMIQ